MTQFNVLETTSANQNIFPASSAAPISKKPLSTEVKPMSLTKVDSNFIMERKAIFAGQCLAFIITTPFVYLFMIPSMVTVGTVSASAIIVKSFCLSFLKSCVGFSESLTEGFNYPEWINKGIYRFDNASIKLVNKVSNLFKHSKAWLRNLLF